MKKVLGIVLVMTMLLSLAACGSGNTPATTPSQTEAETEKKEDALADALNFLKEGEMYFDIQLGADVIKNLSISVDGKTLGSDKKLSFKPGSSYEIKGEGKADAKVMLVIISASKDGDHFRATHEVSKGDADTTAELLSAKLSRVKGQKACVVLMEKADGWDHNLGEAFNQYMEKATIIFK